MTNQEHAQLELKHLQLELSHERTRHIRHFVDSYYCWKHSFVNSRGNVNTDLVVGIGNVSKKAVGITDRKLLAKEHVIPLKVITTELLKLGTEASLEQIAKVIDDLLIFSTITREEDKEFGKHGISRKMPDGFYIEGHELYQDKFARYKVAGIELEFISEQDAF